MTDPRALVDRWIDAFNRRDWATYGECFTEDVTYLTPGRSEPLAGRAAHVEQDQRNAGGGRLRATLVIVGDDGRHVVVEGTFETETRISKWVTVLELRENRIAAERLYFDRFRG
ncbi:MAG: hypothetical protein KatS3mg060_3006 [Dehalococcoidia bacterium]|jgi:ketosteroid isomerase-like protein|nr:MAG: hypothetical protein KatS3mg060_3006 [Dehalococcoidia bacterium]